MQIQEQIYTSASELLEPGQSGLGVVAQSVGFPRKVSSQLSTLASYRLLDAIPVDQISSHPAKILAMPQESGKYFSVSRIVFAGADHTGRTTPLVHHALFSADSLTQENATVTQVVVALRGHFLNQWTQQPIQYDPARSLSVTESSTRLPSIGTASKEFLASVLGLFSATSNRLSDTSKPPIVFVLPIEQREAALDLLTTLTSVLAVGQQRELTFQSHVVATNDLVGRVSVVATYPKSEYLTEMIARPEKRRPTIFDLTDSSVAPIQNVGFAAWLESGLLSGADLKVLHKGIALRSSLDDLDEQKHPEGFQRLLRFFHLLKAANVLENVDEIGQQIQSLSSMSPSAANLVQSWTGSTIKTHVEKHKQASNWNGLIGILSRATWPTLTRSLCFKAIAKLPEHSFPFVIASEEAKRVPELTKHLDDSIQKTPQVWGRLLQSTAEVASTSRRFLECRLVSGKLEPTSERRAAEILIKTGDGVQQQYQAARLLFTSPNQSQAKPVSTFGWLKSVTAEPGWLQGLLDQGELPPAIADELHRFLHPPPPTQAADREPWEGDERAGGNEAQAIAVNFASGQPGSAGKKNSGKNSHFTSPNPTIRITAMICSVVTILGGIAFGVGKFQNISSLSSTWSLIAVGVSVICLLVGVGAHVLFANNRIVKRRYRLMWFGFVSVILMGASAVGIAYTFAAPFLLGGNG